VKTTTPVKNGVKGFKEDMERKHLGVFQIKRLGHEAEPKKCFLPKKPQRSARAEGNIAAETSLHFKQRNVTTKCAQEHGDQEKTKKKGAKA